MTKFTARWGNHPAQPDPSMTRERAARLLRCWRRNARQNSNNGRWTLTRNGLHSFTVSAPQYPTEVHTIEWTTP